MEKLQNFSWSNLYVSKRHIYHWIFHVFDVYDVDTREKVFNIFFQFFIKNKNNLYKFKTYFYAPYLIFQIGWNRKQPQFVKFFEIFGTWQKWILRCFQSQKFIFCKNKARNRIFIVLWTLSELTFSVSYRNGKKWKKITEKKSWDK